MNPSASLLNQGIFTGILIVFAAVFTVLHIFNKRAPPNIEKILKRVSPEYIEQKASDPGRTPQEDYETRFDVIAEYLGISRDEVHGITRSSTADVDLEKLTMTQPELWDPWVVLKMSMHGREKFREEMAKRPPIIIKWRENYFISEGNHRCLAAHLMGERSIRTRIIEITDDEAVEAFERSLRPELEEKNACPLNAFF